MTCDVDTVLRHYQVCALWSSVGEDQEPLDADYGVDDIHPDSVKVMREDVERFLADNVHRLALSRLSDEQIGHDFWLTRNRHGAGFWDRGLPKILGHYLTESAHEFGECYLFVDADGKVRCE